MEHSLVVPSTSSERRWNSHSWNGRASRLRAASCVNSSYRGFFLAVRGVEQVALRPSVVPLCHSLAASMICAPALVKLEVTSDDSRVNADTSVSFGLLVTELVINVLKACIPGWTIRNDRGRLPVRSHRLEALRWRRWRGNGGVSPVPGLGTSIVQALAGHLEATVSVENTDPGTLVSIVHDSADAPAAPPAV